jgi:hypothetical protein
MPKSGEPKQHVPVFVGSTYEDLKDYRTAVREALHRLEAIVRGMEYFGSKPGTPKNECLKAVQSCKAYIGIFAMRYGSIDDESGKSMTHIEYDEAQRLRLPTLIYIIDEERQPVLPIFVDTGEKAQLLRDLKEELKKNYQISFFTTPEDLAKRIGQDLPAVLEGVGVHLEPEPQEGPKVDASTGLRLLFDNRAALTQDPPGVLRRLLFVSVINDARIALDKCILQGIITGANGGEHAYRLCAPFSLLIDEHKETPVLEYNLDDKRHLIMPIFWKQEKGEWKREPGGLVVSEGEEIVLQALSSAPRAVRLRLAPSFEGNHWKFDVI